MLPVKDLAQKIRMAVNYCSCQLTRRLGWAAPAYHKKIGATPHPVVRRYRLLYGGRPDGRLGVRAWT